MGAKVLSFIPQAVTAHTHVDFRILPRIMASCDALVKDGGSGGTPHPPLPMPPSTACSAQHVSTFPATQVLWCAS